jgi:hypothetical protein
MRRQVNCQSFQILVEQLFYQITLANEKQPDPPRTAEPRTPSYASLALDTQ